jgi:integral membrane protein
VPDHTLRLFRVAALLEAVSWAALLTGMFFKYVVVHDEIGVKIAGPIHGALFILYSLSVLLVRERLRWDARTTLLGLVASVPPFASVIFERWARRRAAREAGAGPGQRAGELANR